MTNWQEYLAGTDPQNPQDYLRFDLVTISGTNCVLQFTRRAGCVYAVERMDGFVPSGTWTTLLDNLAGSGSFSYSDPLGPGPRFYRLKAAQAQ